MQSPVALYPTSSQEQQLLLVPEDIFVDGLSLKRYSMEKFQAAMLLGAVGNSLGYCKGRWESCMSGSKIQKELVELGGLAALKLDPENWPLSDGALMHMTTAEALISGMDVSPAGKLN